MKMIVCQAHLLDAMQHFFKNWREVTVRDYLDIPDKNCKCGFPAIYTVGNPS